MRRSIVVLLTALVASGCYHVNVSTGIAPGGTQVQEKWAPSWIVGLVSPDPVDARAQCGNSGVARVESRISFLNGLVSVLTANIFTPMEITVTCGQGGGQQEQQEQQDLQQLGDAGDALPPATGPTTAAR